MNEPTPTAPVDPQHDEIPIVRQHEIPGEAFAELALLQALANGRPRTRSGLFGVASANLKNLLEEFGEFVGPGLSKRPHLALRVALRRCYAAGWIASRFRWFGVRYTKTAPGEPGKRSRFFRPGRRYVLTALGDSAALKIQGPRVPMQWSPSESLLAFLSWLDWRKAKVTMGHGAEAPVHLVSQFCQEQGLSQVRPGWRDAMIWPSAPPRREVRRHDDHHREAADTTGAHRNKRGHLGVVAAQKTKASKKKRQAEAEALTEDLAVLAACNNEDPENIPTPIHQLNPAQKPPDDG